MPRPYEFRIIGGTVFRITCMGFEPNAETFAYTTGPDGTAMAYVVGFGIPNQKTDVGGNVTYLVPTAFPPNATLASGTWRLTVEQGNLVGIAEFTIMGGSEGVSGASLVASADTFGPGQVVRIIGSGFASGEVVTVWFDFPNSECSSMTEHHGNFFTFPFFVGLGSVLYGNLTANPPGNISFNFGPPEASPCRVDIVISFRS